MNVLGRCLIFVNSRNKSVPFQQAVEIDSAQSKEVIDKMARLSRLLYFYVLVFPRMVLFNIFNRILYLIRPSSFKNEGTLTDDWMASNRFLKTISRGMAYQVERETDLNGPAINVDLHSLSSKTTVSLLQFMKQNRPLIVNFGSCT